MTLILDAKSIHVQYQAAFLCGRNPQGFQGLFGRTFLHLAAGIVERAVAGTFVAAIFLLHGAAEMGANQAESAEAIAVMDQDCRNVQEEAARIERVVDRRSQVELGWRSGVKLKGEEADQSAQAEQPGESQQAVGGKS